MLTFSYEPGGFFFFLSQKAIIYMSNKTTKKISKIQGQYLNIVLSTDLEYVKQKD
jgi:hypothetical protein